MCRNVTNDMIQETIDEYVKYRIPLSKNRVVLTYTNFVEKVALWFKLMLQGEEMA